MWSSASFGLGDILWAVSYVTVTLVFCAFGFHRWCIVRLYHRHRREVQAPRERFAELPVVTVQLPIFNEYCVAQRLLAAVAALDYPRDRLEVQVLDDSTDATRELLEAEVEALRAQGLDIVHLHRTDRIGFKAGALEAGMQVARGEFILILDADFIPAPDLLQRTVHFFTDPQVALVQSRWGHLNRNESLLTRAQAILLDGHLVLEQVARSRSGRFFNFNGTAGLWRRRAIEESGGWQHDTLTEDLDLSYRAQVRGWRFLFLPDLVTPAELPADMAGFKSQQHRWAKGSIQTCRKLLPVLWRLPLPWWQKIEAFVHLTANFAYLTLACLCLLLDPLQAGGGGWLTFLFVELPVFILASGSVACFYATALWAVYPGTWWRQIWLLPVVVALGIGLALSNAKAVIEALLGLESPFVRTPKTGTGEAPKPRRYAAARTILLPLAELLLALHFARYTWLAIGVENWKAVPFLALFAAAFAWVGLASLWPLLAAALERAGWRERAASPEESCQVG
ncbi:MAG: glycosyltransferase family 2 protein [Verrucomicrobia bacterium]|nr:glycosyltransferase family 2 protein [Verrucomicrobiota bacterium]